MASKLSEFLYRRGIAARSATKRAQLDEFLALVKPVATTTDLIRVGGAGDGGYLLPDDLDGIAACFSPGVDVTATFEEELAGRGIPSFMADHSVDGPPVTNALFIFEKKFLGHQNDDVFMRLEDWVSNSGVAPDADLLLQMDIEGAEFAVLMDTPPSVLRRFRIMAIEFHDMDMLFTRHAFPFVKQVFDKLAQDFHVVHNHPNNCKPVVTCRSLDVPPVLELTFYRKDRADVVPRALSFPHPLDVTNVPDKEDYALPHGWW